MAKRGQRQRDPAAAGDHPFDPHRRIDQRQEGPGHAAAGAAEQHGAVAGCAARYSRAHAPTPAPRRPRAAPARRGCGTGTRRWRRHSASAAIYQRMLVEQGRPEKRNRRATESPCCGIAEVLADVGMPMKAESADAEQRQRQAGCVLVGAEPQRQQREDPATAARRRRRRRRNRAPGCRSSARRQNRPPRHQHHALGAEIDDARLFIDEQAERGRSTACRRRSWRRSRRS